MNPEFIQPVVQDQAKKLNYQALRCFCARKPMLARYGNDKGKLYIHVRVYKQERVFAEVLVTDGIVKLRCRDCFRWHTVKIVQPNRVTLEESTPPEALPDS